MDLYKIELPNLYESPYIIKQETINNKVFYFEYFWNVRQDKAYLSIYLMDGNIKTYICKSICLTNGIDISNKIKYDNWVGKLYFLTDKLDLNDYAPQDISSNFYLLYRDGELEVS